MLEKLGRVDGAEKAWKRAVEVDENEFDAAVCLAELSHRTGTDDAWDRIACALRRCSAKLARWDRLAEFLASDLVIGAHLAAPPEERPTFLEAFLESDAPLATLDRLPLGALRDTTVARRRPEPQAAWRSSSKKRNRHRRTAEAG